VPRQKLALATTLVSKTTFTVCGGWLCVAEGFLRGLPRETEGLLRGFSPVARRE
jgi:hypothetical protein